MMLRQLINKLRPQPLKRFEVPQPSRMDMRDIEKAFARLFSTTDGQAVLGYLNGQTFMRALGIDAPDSTLRYLEGQRALLSSILRLIERGRTN